MEREKANVIRDKLYMHFGDRGCALEHETPYELLVATILSAQCTDVRVNKVTEKLFKSADTPEKMVSLGYEHLHEIIKSCGLANSKAKNIIAMSQSLIDNYNSSVPSDFDELILLSGVGRKTANVVLSNAFGVDAIAVDTHVFRVSNRIGLAHADNVLKTEKDLNIVFDKSDWSRMHHMLIWHGRETCRASHPLCTECVIYDECEYIEKKK